MILPILISLSLAPGSYFFCALAADAASRTAVATVRPTKSVARFGIVLSLLGILRRLSQPDESRSSGLIHVLDGRRRRSERPLRQRCGHEPVEVAVEHARCI